MKEPTSASQPCCRTLVHFMLARHGYFSTIATFSCPGFIGGIWSQVRSIPRHVARESRRAGGAETAPTRRHATIIVEKRPNTKQS